MHGDLLQRRYHLNCLLFAHFHTLLHRGTAGANWWLRCWQSRQQSRWARPQEEQEVPLCQPALWWSFQPCCDSLRPCESQSSHVIFNQLHDCRLFSRFNRKKKTPKQLKNKFGVAFPPHAGTIWRHKNEVPGWRTQQAPHWPASVCLSGWLTGFVKSFACCAPWVLSIWPTIKCVHVKRKSVTWTFMADSFASHVFTPACEVEVLSAFLNSWPWYQSPKRVDCSAYSVWGWSSRRGRFLSYQRDAPPPDSLSVPHY